MKKIYALLLTVIMALTMIPVNVFADDYIDTDVEIGLIDIGNVWTDLSSEEIVPFTAELNPEIPELSEQMEISDETWTDIETNDRISLTRPDYAEDGQTYHYSISIDAKDGYKFADNIRFVYGGTEYTPNIEYYGAYMIEIDGFIDDVTVGESGGTVTPSENVDVTIDTYGSGVLAEQLAIEPVIDENLFAEAGLDKSQMTEEEIRSFAWRALLNKDDVSNVTIKVDWVELSDEIKDIISDTARTDTDPVRIKDYAGSYDITVYADNTPVDVLYGGLQFTMTYLPNTRLRVFNINEYSAFTAEGQSFSDETATWTAYDAGALGFAIAEVADVTLMTQAINTVEVNGATLKFKAGDDVVFTGQVADNSLYDIVEDTCEQWDGDDYTAAVSIGTGDPYTQKFTTFQDGVTYAYSVGVLINEDAYASGYYFPSSVQLKLNGKVVNASKYLSDGSWYEDGRCVSFYDIAPFTANQYITYDLTEDGTINNIADQTYTGKAITPGVTVVANGVTLVNGTDYTVSYKNNVNAGTATVTATGKGTTYKGSISKTFKINAKNATPTVSVSKEVVYNGKTPAITVKVGSQKIAASGYTASFTDGGKSIGQHKVTVTLKGNYKGTGSASYTVLPKATKISKAKAAKKSMTVKWKKVDATGYQIQYGTKKNFKSAKTVNVKKANATSQKIKKLKGGKKYYVRIRAYKTVNGKTLYSAWSPAKNAVVKK